MSGHPPLTKVIMDSWRPWELAEAKLTGLANAIRENSEAAERTVDQVPNTSWAGGARSAANARASDQNGWAKKVAAKVDDLQTALNNAAAAIDSSKTAVNGALLGASMQRFLLVSESDPSWKMRYVPKEDDELTPGQIADMEREMTSFVKGKADELATTASDHAALIQTTVGNLNTIAPPALTLSAQDGRRHGQLAADGWTDEEAAAVGRSLRAAGLSDEQIARLMNGEKLDDVPRGVQEYLHTFYGSVGSDGLFDLKSKFDGMHTPAGESWSKALGQGLLTLSNENVGANIGYQYLPGWVQDWAENRASDGATLRYQDVPFASLLGNSGSVPPGERLGTELIRRGAAGASRDIGGDGQRPEVAYGAFETDPNELKRTYESTIRQFLEVGTRNHESATAILTGEYSDGTKLADYNRDETVGHLMRHDWDDHGTTVGGLVDWIHEYSGTGDPAKIAQADRAFAGLWDFATSTDNDNNFKSLMNTNDDGDAIGKINPHLADALRKASLPYLNYLANPDASPQIHGHPDLELTDHENPNEFRARAIRMFSLIASDDSPNGGEPTEENPDGINAATELYRDLLARANMNASLVLSEPHLAQSLGLTSGELLQLGQSGIYGAQYDQELDRDSQVQRSEAATQNTIKILSSASYALTLVPHGAVPSALIGGAAPWFAGPDINDDVPFNLPSGDAALGVGDSETQKLSFSYSMLTSAGVSGPAEWYDSSGTLKPLSDMLTQQNGDASQLDQAIRTVLATKYQREFTPGGEADYWDKGVEEGLAPENSRYDGSDLATYREWILDGTRE
ncbi:hypothetical protein M1C59_06530 [Gordonia terrae]|uniref:TPR repeat region-containing protein n=1 Tax=Gordonia terrae TaxID=2055 RepID=UPI00200A26D0|nr:hypothetical protein [Gordonia terrae]UPW10489.1 hypothetical protein M1C59_06530 [Gordonia terrae]